ncbi:MAG: hypothetical protein BWY84_01000 [Candidatus Aerophobetes bacterium ADurb.Bin490]|nr:MAG: hypothetical protein BWY84_01000 [Candidatus Aerophobetes bacterium ADurb.Bin490]
MYAKNIKSPPNENKDPLPDTGTTNDAASTAAAPATGAAAKIPPEVALITLPFLRNLIKSKNGCSKGGPCLPAQKDFMLLIMPAKINGINKNTAQ